MAVTMAKVLWVAKAANRNHIKSGVSQLIVRLMVSASHSCTTVTPYHMQGTDMAKKDEEEKQDLNWPCKVGIEICPLDPAKFTGKKKDALKRFVALKVQKSYDHYTEAAMDEITILKQIAEGDPDDKKCMVKHLYHFKHSGPNGQQVCMVFEYLGDNLLTLKYSDYRGVPLHKVKEICYHVLVRLDYLQKQLSIMHTDLKPENILLMSMIDSLKDPTKSRAPLILAGGKDKDASESGKAKRAVQECVNRDEADADVETSTEVEGSKRGNRTIRQKLLASIDLKCKFIDFGNACFYPL
ncbi:uncharacterized protein [Pyrus communis]|uniref:uncharacterized protein n=1 Tax=Pyrus communis TaxID=23211 RepID=UPI0035C18180